MKSAIIIFGVLGTILWLRWRSNKIPDSLGAFVPLTDERKRMLLRTAQDQHYDLFRD